jgi:hypothetical protein
VTSAITKYTFTVNAAAANTNGFTGTILGTISGLPANVSASPATFTLTLGTPTDVTITAATGAALGNSVFTVGTTSGSGSSQIVHNMPVVLNIGTQAQSFQLSTPAAMSLTSSGTAVGYIGVTPINGFNGKVTLSLGTLPPGVTGVLSSSTIWPNTLTPDTGNQFQSLVTLTLTGGTFTGTTQNSITLTGTATGVATPPANTIVLTTSNAATNTVNATVQTSTTAAAFPSQFVGFSLSKTPFDAFTASSTATANFANLMKNFGPYVGLPLVRTQLESTNGSNVSALETDATYASDKLNFFFTESSAFNLGADQSEGSGMITNVGGSSQFFGAELDNEPDGYPGSSPDGLSGAAIRPASWTFADYLNELSSYKNDSLTGPYITAALAGSYWIPGIPALVTALGTGSGGIADFTLHRYAGCITPDQLLLDEYSHNYYHDRFAGLVKTLPSSVPVRSGEMNTSQCATVSGGGTAAGDTFAESLWMIDTAFELNAAGATGFNLHSEGAAGAPDTYDIAAVDGSGNITVRPPYYGTLFFAEAIQNGAQPLPVTIQQMSGNVKVWATIDSSNVIRVMVLEKDDDSSSKTIHLNLGSYSSTATQLTMSSSTGVSGNESHITIGGAAFNVTTSNGLLNGTPSTTNVTPALVSGSYIYSFTVNDGTATLLTIP